MAVKYTILIEAVVPDIKMSGSNNKMVDLAERISEAVSKSITSMTGKENNTTYKYTEETVSDIPCNLCKEFCNDTCIGRVIELS